MKIIDEWVDKWGYIFRSLIKKTQKISFDLSGGFESRILLPILLNSGIDINHIIINTNKHENSTDNDSNIVNNISSKYGFQIDNLKINNKVIKRSSKDSLSSTIYTKLGFHKEFYLKDKFFQKPLFLLSGCGVEDIIGSPGYPINEYLNRLSTRNIKNNKEKLFNSSINLLNRSVDFLRNERILNNDYEIANILYSKILGRNHFGKTALESFISNIYMIQPLMDPDIRKIKYNMNRNTTHDLLAYILIRFSPDLINYPFNGNRSLSPESIKRAKKLERNLPTYIRRYDYNDHFFIDDNRNSPEIYKNDKNNAEEYLKEFFKSNKYFEILNKLYDKNIYNFAKKYSNISNSFPLRHEYALLSIVVAIEYISINEKCLKKSVKHNCFLKRDKILNQIIN